MSKAKILIVDDDADSRAVLCDALAHEPYTLIEARDGQEAIQLANSELPDLILLDIMLPDMDGDIVLHKLREQAETSSIPVIMVTALSICETQVCMSLGDGAVDHICKPFSGMMLRAQVQAALRSHTFSLMANGNGQRSGDARHQKEATRQGLEP